MNNHWEIHEVNGHLVFVEISAYASRCLYMDKHCEQVMKVMVYQNLTPYTPPTDEIESYGVDSGIYESE